MQTDGETDVFSLPSASTLRVSADSLTDCSNSKRSVTHVCHHARKMTTTLDVFVLHQLAVFCIYRIYLVLMGEPDRLGRQVISHCIFRLCSDDPLQTLNNTPPKCLVQRHLVLGTLRSQSCLSHAFLPVIGGSHTDPQGKRPQIPVGLLQV